MKVLITGGAGFIGTHLVRSLLADGHEVRVIDDMSSGSEDVPRMSYTDLRIDFRQASILEDDMLDQLAEGCDAVVHLAALISAPESVKDPLGVHRVNVTGTLRALEAARRHQVPRVVFASSAAVYGNQGGHPGGIAGRPTSPYGASKLAAEAYAAAYAEVYGVDVKVLRLFNVYGPDQRADHPYAPVVARFVDRAKRGLPLQIHGDGKQVREFVHVFNVCDVVRRALGDPRDWLHPVDVAFDQPTSLLGLAWTLEQVYDRPLAGVEWLPRRPGDIAVSGSSGVRLHELMPDLEPIDLERGLANMLHRGA